MRMATATTVRATTTAAGVTAATAYSPAQGYGSGLTRCSNPFR